MRAHLCVCVCVCVGGATMLGGLRSDYVPAKTFPAREVSEPQVAPVCSVNSPPGHIPCLCSGHNNLRVPFHPCVGLEFTPGCTITSVRQRKSWIKWELLSVHSCVFFFCWCYVGINTVLSYLFYSYVEPPAWQAFTNQKLMATSGKV